MDETHTDSQYDLHGYLFVDVLVDRNGRVFTDPVLLWDTVREPDSDEDSRPHRVMEYLPHWYLLHEYVPVHDEE